MTEIYIAWAISAGVMVLVAVVLGFVVQGGGPLGILIDSRGRFSLTHLQITLWTLVVLSLISGIFWGRLVDGVDDPLDFSIPSEVLGVLGISAGSAIGATTVKAMKNARSLDAGRIAASGAEERPRLAQIFLLEEGAYADKVVDIAKFQNFIITLVLLVAYIGLAVTAIDDQGTAIGGLPGFRGTFVTLLGISHGAYLLGKLPTQAGTPEGLTMKNLLDPSLPRPAPRNP
jgi:hypothetical protein